ncbi:MAG TPA: hypothetical protein VE999_05130 [Gemmataceae bacterium]|nr:hypothetical protein [Gemmataceae bacterium]
MAAQRGVQPSADVLKTFSPGKMPEELRLCKRSGLARQLAALIAVAAVIISTCSIDPSPLAANPPHRPPAGPSPQQIQHMLQEQQRKEQQMLQELLKQQQRWREQMKKRLEEHQKHLQQMKALGGNQNALKHTAKPNASKHRAKPTHSIALGPKHFPNRKQACKELIQASRHIQAADGFPIEPKGVALGSIGQALVDLGEGPPSPAPPLQRGNHIHWAEEHLQSARNDVMNARHLPHEVKVPVLAEIHRAMFVLRHPGMPHPRMEQARRELVLALHQVHAADGLPHRSKEEALTKIGEALLVLGEAPPTPVVPDQKEGHVRRAEAHLHRAYRDVFEARHLPHYQRAPVLWDIHRALFALTHPDTPHPNMKPAIDELVRAWHQVDAAHGMSHDRKELARDIIGEAIIVLGEPLPRPRTPSSNDDHIKRAEEHLHKAHSDVVSQKHLPHELKESVLGEIHRATVVLKHPKDADKGEAASK